MLKKFILFSVLSMTISSNSAFAFSRGDNGYFCYFWQSWWVKYKSAATVQIEDVSNEKYRVKFRDSVTFSETSHNYDKGEYAWVWKGDLERTKSACDARWNF